MGDAVDLHGSPPRRTGQRIRRDPRGSRPRHRGCVRLRRRTRSPRCTHRRAHVGALRALRRCARGRRHRRTRRDVLRRRWCHHHRRQSPLDAATSTRRGEIGHRTRLSRATGCLTAPRSRARCTHRGGGRPVGPHPDRPRRLRGGVERVGQPAALARRAHAASHACAHLGALHRPGVCRRTHVAPERSGWRHCRRDRSATRPAREPPTGTRPGAPGCAAGSGRARTRFPTRHPCAGRG